MEINGLFSVRQCLEWKKNVQVRLLWAYACEKHVVHVEYCLLLRQYSLAHIWKSWADFSLSVLTKTHLNYVNALLRQIETLRHHWFKNLLWFLLCLTTKKTKYLNNRKANRCPQLQWGRWCQVQLTTLCALSAAKWNKAQLEIWLQQTVWGNLEKFSL